MCLRVIIFLLLCLAAVACRSSTTPSENPSTPAQQPTASPATTTQSPTQASVQPDAAIVKPKLDACALLTSDEIKSVQGESTKETKLTGQISGGLSISQCFFTLPTFNNSISLIVAHKGDGAGSREPKEFWRTTFHSEKRSEREKEARREEAEEESDPPRRVSGLGDEAFWMGNRIAGALYVLKGDAYVRISVGGPADKASQNRARLLAQKAISRL